MPSQKTIEIFDFDASKILQIFECYVFCRLLKIWKIFDVPKIKVREKCVAFFYTGGNEISSATKNHRFFVGIKNHRFFKIFVNFVKSSYNELCQKFIFVACKSLENHGFSMPTKTVKIIFSWPPKSKNFECKLKLKYRRYFNALLVIYGNYGRNVKISEIYWI